MWIAVNAPVATFVELGYDSSTPTNGRPPTTDEMVPTALKADCVSREQTYRFPVCGLYDDGLHRAPPRTPGATAVYWRRSKGLKMQPIRKGRPSDANLGSERACAQWFEKRPPAGIGCVRAVFWNLLCGTGRSSILLAGWPFRRRSW